MRKSNTIADEFIERREKIIKQFGPKFDNNPHYLLFKFGFPPTTTTLSWEEYSKACQYNFIICTSLSVCLFL